MRCGTGELSVLNGVSPFDTLILGMGNGHVHRGDRVDAGGVSEPFVCARAIDLQRDLEADLRLHDGSRPRLTHTAASDNEHARWEPARVARTADRAARRPLEGGSCSRAAYRLRCSVAGLSET